MTVLRKKYKFNSNMKMYSNSFFQILLPKFILMDLMHVYYL